MNIPKGWYVTCKKPVLSLFSHYVVNLLAENSAEVIILKGTKIPHQKIRCVAFLVDNFSIADVMEADFTRHDELLISFTISKVSGLAIGHIKQDIENIVLKGCF